MSNPFFSDFNTPFDTYPFDKIKVEHFLPAIEEGIKQGLAEVETIVNNKETPSFSNTIEALEKAPPTKASNNPNIPPLVLSPNASSLLGSIPGNTM